LTDLFTSRKRRLVNNARYQVNPASVSQVKTLAENLFPKNLTAFPENWLSSSLKQFHWASQISSRTEVRQESEGNADYHHKSDRVRVAVESQKDDFSSNQHRRAPVKHPSMHCQF
jgi:hypothetical protein